MADFDTTDQFEAMKRIWAPWSDNMSQQMQAFWSNQENLFRRTREFSQQWLERRHEATDTALKAASSITGAKTAVDALQEYQNWMVGSMQRMIADSASCQQHLMSIAETCMAQMPLKAEVEKAAEAARSMTRNVAARAEAA